MSLHELLANAEPTGEHTVPNDLIGCWRRNWIRFGDNGERQSQTRVIWLQTASGMGDLRVDPGQAAHETDSSCGITVVDESTSPHITADWLDGASGFAQQLVSNFPEKGWLTWDSPSVMRELAPSGAYVEEWERFADSAGPTAHLIAIDAPGRVNLYVAGDHAMYCAQNLQPTGVHEFSWGRQVLETRTVVIELSTMPDRVGQTMDLDRPWHVESYCET